MGEIVIANVEKRGRPESKVALDMERRRPSIPSGSITPTMLAQLTKNLIVAITPTYGSAKYGRSRYSTRPGIYGYDRYGSCTYG